MTLFFRVLEAAVDEKPVELLRAVDACRVNGTAGTSSVFESDPALFSVVPGSPFAYWVSAALEDVFRRLKPFESNDRTAKCGAGTLDDFRFLRVWWEVDDAQFADWRLFAKGGSFSPFYADIYLSIGWHMSGVELCTYVESKVGSATRKIQAQNWYFRPGLSWPRRTTSGFGVRVMPAGCIFGDKGPAAFVEGDSVENLFAFSAVLNSAPFGYLVGVQLAAADAAARSYEVGVIQRTPVPELTQADTTTLSKLAHRAWSLKRSLDTTNETSHAFLLPPGINERVTGLHPAAVQRELDEIQAQIDDHAFRLYGIGDEDRATIEASSKRGSNAATDEASDSDSDDEAEENPLISAPADTLLSWLVGVAFGRFDPRIATGVRPSPPEPAPFDALPSRSPGMWPEDEEPNFVPPDILVDDPGHDDDLRSHVANAAAHAGVPDPDDLRQWLAKEFFALHIKLYSKSRRKAPIYWQLATPTASYSVWLYIHAFTPDTFFRVQNDYVGPKLAHEERRLESLTLELRDQVTNAQRKELAAQQALVEELRAFHAEVKRVTPLWNPNLDDGVVINFAPLWRLVPQHRAWQRELKTVWDALCQGKYDWSHQAMHLWPERVIPKCAKDRSLAIAHGVEDVFWVEGDDGKWTARKSPTRDVKDLINERSSPAVQAGLKSLLDAPAAAGTTKKPKGRGKKKS